MSKFFKTKPKAQKESAKELQGEYMQACIKLGDLHSKLMFAKDEIANLEAAVAGAEDDIRALNAQYKTFAETQTQDLQKPPAQSASTEQEGPAVQQ